MGCTSCSAALCIKYHNPYMQNAMFLSSTTHASHTSPQSAANMQIHVHMCAAGSCCHEEIWPLSYTVAHACDFMSATASFLLQVNFMLGNDDHDLHMRAWFQKRWIVGWMPLDFKAPLHLGGTRRGGQPQEAENLYKTARQVRMTGGYRPPSADSGHSEDRPIPQDCGCMRSALWYLNATLQCVGS